MLYVQDGVWSGDSQVRRSGGKKTSRACQMARQLGLLEAPEGSGKARNQASCLELSFPPLAPISNQQFLFCPGYFYIGLLQHYGWMIWDLEEVKQSTA